MGVGGREGGRVGVEGGSGRVGEGGREGGREGDSGKSSYPHSLCSEGVGGYKG